MTKITLDVKGLKELARKVKSLPNELQQVVKRAISTSAVNIQRTAKRAAPVDTGRLRSSIRFSVDSDGMAGEVFTDVEYAQFQEFGTGRRGSAQHPPLPEGYVHGSSAGVEAQPYLFPAWTKERPKLLKNLADVAGVAFDE